MSFRIFATIILGVIAASAITVLIASQIAIHLQLSPVFGLAGFGVLALAASLVLRRHNG